MMHDGKGFVLIGLNLGGLPATVGIIDDENGDIRPILIAQVVNFVHVSIALVGKAPQMHELITRLDVVGLIGMDGRNLMWRMPLMRKDSLPPSMAGSITSPTISR